MTRFLVQSRVSAGNVRECSLKPSCGKAILDISQVAITMDYRYPGRAGALLSRENDRILLANPENKSSLY